jgi:hypothetical protein
MNNDKLLKSSIKTINFYDKGPQESKKDFFLNLLYKQILAEKLESLSKGNPLVKMVHKILKDAPLMQKQLKKLNSELAQIAQQEGRYNPATPEKGLLDFQPSKKYAHKKLLTNFFRHWATENGFKGAVSLTSFESSEQFIKHLQDGQLILKDKVFQGLPHGQFSHMIQWYCLVEALKANEPIVPSVFLTLLQRFGEKDPEFWFYCFEYGPGLGEVGKVQSTINITEGAVVLQQLINSREAKASAAAPAPAM